MSSAFLIVNPNSAPVSGLPISFFHWYAGLAKWNSIPSQNPRRTRRLDGELAPSVDIISDELVEPMYLGKEDKHQCQHLRRNTGTIFVIPLHNKNWCYNIQQLRFFPRKCVSDSQRITAYTFSKVINIKLTWADTSENISPKLLIPHTKY